MGKSQPRLTYRLNETSTVVEVPNERVARELAPLRDQPERMAQVFRPMRLVAGARISAGKVAR
jgi:hypothetical protein